MQRTATKTRSTPRGIFGVIPGSGQVGGTHSPEATAFWWKVLEDIFQYAFDNFDGADLGWVPTLEQAQEIRTEAVMQQVYARAVALNGRRAGIPPLYSPGSIQRMFENWRVYYPFVDSVAVSRAVDFHRDAWAGLTMREHRLVVVKLAAMFDPYEDSNIVRTGGGDSRVTKGASRPVTATSPRASRWLEFDPKDRKVLLDLVQRRRRTRGV